MRRYQKRFGLLSILIALALTAGACSSKDVREYSTNDSDAGNVSYQSKSDVEYNFAEEGISEEEAEPQAADDGSGWSDTDTSGSNASEVQSQDKIIRTFHLEVETQEFDALIADINSDIDRLEGYVENSEISGKRYYQTEGARYGTVVVRIPSSKVDEFIHSVGNNANVINKQESTRNVSLEYIDTKSRIETLEIEQERLYAILDKELSLENIITLENRLSDIRYELQNYESKLRYYDNQVSYSTVRLNIQEVEKLTPVTEEKQTVGMRIKNGFSNTMYHITEGFKSLFVWFVVNLPYLFLWAAAISVMIRFIRKGYKKRVSGNADLPPVKNLDSRTQNIEDESRK